jgi:hypothetical protein
MVRNVEGQMESSFEEIREANSNEIGNHLETG